MRRGYTGWVVPENERWKLLAIQPAVYQRVILHHCTHTFGVDESFPLPLRVPAVILGFADDGEGVQCAIIEIGGTSERPDGSVFHITWSLAEGRKAVESNQLAQRWMRDRSSLDPDKQYAFMVPPPIDLIPQFFPL